MDKLLHKNWLVKILSFVMAMMLYAIVSSGESPSPSPSSVAVTPSHQVTITEQLDVKYNQEKYVVSGQPKTVALRLTGSNDLIIKARLLASKRAYIDLTNRKAGTYDVRVQTSGFPSGLSVKAVPSTVRVTLQDKTAKEFPVTIDVLNKKAIADDYEIGKPSVSPDNVTITGGSETIDSIAFVRGVVNVRDADSTVDKSIVLHAYDSSGTQLDVQMDPSAVRVHIPINKIAKRLTLQARAEGKPAKGYTVDSVDLSENHVTVYAADTSALDAIAAVQPLSVPVDGLKEDKTVTLKVPLPTGASKVSPQRVEATIHVSKTGGSSDSSSSDSGSGSDSGSDSSSDSSSSDNNSSDSGSTSSTTGEARKTRSFTNIPVTVEHADGQKTELSHNGRVDVEVSGKASKIDQLSAGDILARVDLQGLSGGNHRNITVQLQVPHGLTAVASPKTLDVSIS